MRKPPTLGSLRNDDDSTRTAKKQEVELCSCIMLFFTVAARLKRESAQLLVSWRTGTQDNDHLFSFPPLNFDTVSEFYSRKIFQHLTNWTRWNGRDKTWSKWRFRNRCCCWAPYFATPPKVSPWNDVWGTERAGDWLKENHQCIFYAIFFIWNTTKSQ